MSARSTFLAAASFTYLALVGSLAAAELPLTDVSHIHGIGFDAANPGSVLLATHYGVYRARPDRTAETVSEDANDYMGFSIDPADAGRLLASGHPGQGGNLGVIASTDGGSTWTKISEGAEGPVDFHAMSFSPADPKVIYGLYGGIQVSRDGGVAWGMVGPGPEVVIDLAGSAIDTDTVYAGTTAGLMQSDDGGVSWSLIGPSGRAATMVETTGDGSLYVFFAGAGLYRLTKASSWQELATKFGERYIMHLAADPTDPQHLVAVTEESTVLESRDGGATWQGFAE